MVTAVAWLWRVVFVVVGRGSGPPIGDGELFSGSARLLAEGEGFIHPTIFETMDLSWPMAMKAPLYTVYLAGWSLLGVDSYLGQRLVSTLLGAAVVPVCAWVVYRLAGSRAGLVAAVLAAANPSLWIVDASLLSESLYALCVAGVVWASYRLWDRPDGGRAALLGLLIGLAALTRYEGLAFVPLTIPLFVGLPRRSASTKVYLFTITSLVVVASLAPWSAYNLGRFEEPVLLGPSPGPLTLSANCDTTYSGSLLGYHDLGCASIAEDELAMLAVGCPCPVGDRVCLVERCRTLIPDESQLFDYMHEQGLDYIRAHRHRVPIVVAARVGRIWNVFRPLQGVDLDTRFELRGWLPSLSGLVFFWALVPLALVGMVALRRHRIPIAPLVALFLVPTFAVAATMGVTRYRVPIDVGLVLAAAVGVEVLWRGRSPTSTPRDRTEVSALAGGAP